MQFKVEKPEFALSHILRPGQGLLTIDFENQILDLEVQRLSACPIGRICSQIVQTPLRVKLPIISVESDNCGVKTIVAFQDLRDTNGKLEQIIVTDSSNIICKMLVQSQAVYETVQIDPYTKNEVATRSRMNLQRITKLIHINQ